MPRVWFSRSVPQVFVACSCAVPFRATLRLQLPYRLPTVARHHTMVEAVASACRWKGWKGQWAAASAGGGKRQKSAWALVSPDRRKRNNNGCALASAVAVGRGGNMCEQLHLRAVGIVGGKGEEKDSVCFTAGPFCPAGGVRAGRAGNEEGS